MLTNEECLTLKALAEADDATFTDLVKIARLDPARAFRGADLHGVDFGDADLYGYDFTEADLSGANFERASIRGANFTHCQTDGTRWPRAMIEVKPLTHELTDMQQEAVISMLSDLMSTRRAIVLMPIGTGRAVVLEEAICRSIRHESCKPALLIVNTVAEREQFAHSLGQRLGSDAVAMARVIEELPLSGGLTVCNAGFRDLSLGVSGRLRELFRGFGAIFTTSLEKVAQIERASGNNLESIRVATVDSLPVDVNRPDRRQFMARMHRLFGEPSYVCSVERAIQVGLLEPARILRLPMHAWKHPQQLRPGRRATYLSYEYTRSLAEEIVEIAGNSEVPSLLVLSSDNEQLDMLQDILSKRRHPIPRKVTRLVGRWDPERLPEPVEQLPGIILTQLSRKALEAARRHAHVAVISPLAVLRAQELAYRPRGVVTSGDATLYDFADAFAGFHDFGLI